MPGFAWSRWWGMWQVVVSRAQVRLPRGDRGHVCATDGVAASIGRAGARVKPDASSGLLITILNIKLKIGQVALSCIHVANGWSGPACRISMRAARSFVMSCLTFAYAWQAEWAAMECSEAPWRSIYDPGPLPSCWQGNGYTIGMMPVFRKSPCPWCFLLRVWKSSAPACGRHSCRGLW